MIFNILCLLLISLNVNCQVLPLYTPSFERTNGVYLKDLDNEMDKYAGTWQYTHGTDTLTIVLQKKIHLYNGEFYEDYLVGEYKYVQNGIEILNFIPFLFTQPDNIDNRNIGGRYFVSNNEVVVCNDCDTNEKRIELYFSDPDRPYLTSISLVLRYLLTSFGESEKIMATIVPTHGVIIPDENSPTVPRVPYGEYLMIKQ